MEKVGLNPDLLLKLTSMIPKESVNVLLRSTQLMNKNISNILTNPWYWKERTEYLLNTHLTNIEANWEQVYKILDDALKKEDPVSTAASKGNITAVKILLDLKNDSNEFIYKPNGDTLGNAAYSGNIDLVNYLLSIPGMKPDMDNNKPLYDAVQGGNLNMVKYLLTYPEVDVTAHEDAALNIASLYGRAEVVKYLLTLKNVDPTQSYAIEDAIAGQHINIIKILKKDGRIHFDDYLLVYAAETGNVEIIKILISYGLNPSSDSIIANNAPLIIAVKGNHIEAVKYLLTVSKVDPASNNNLAIRTASDFGFSKIVELLLENGANPAVNGNECIISASAGGKLDVVKLLLKDQRVDPSAKGNEAIIRASIYEHQEVIDLLLSDSRVNPKAVENYNNMIKAAKNDDVNDIKLILNSKKIYPFASNLYVNFPIIMETAKLEVTDSILGSIALYNEFSYGDWEAENRDIRGDAKKDYEYYDDFATRYTRYLITSKASPIECIKKLESFSIESPILKNIVLSVCENLLTQKDLSSRYWNNQNARNLYQGLKAFMLSICYKPPYTYKEIHEIMDNEHYGSTAKAIAGKFIGAFFGLERLLKEGLVIAEAKLKGYYNIRNHLNPANLIYNI
jgi:ankyrin repeat protein